MKTIKYYSVCAISALAFLFPSCDERLDVDLPDNLATSNFWRNQSDAESGLAAVYSKLECATDPWEFSEVRFPVETYRDDLCQMGSDALNYKDWVELYNFTYINTNTQFSNYWATYYSGILFANQVMEKAAPINMDETYKKEILAEARFLRALYHMRLLLNWNQIIVRDQYIESESMINKALSSREEAWDFIINDFEKAVLDLADKQPLDKLGRATKGAGYAYLGFSYLTRAYEEPAKTAEYLAKAETAFNGVKGYGLVKNYLSMFDGTNKNSEESVFELQFTDNTANGAEYRTVIHKWIGVSELGGWDEITPSRFLLDEFKKEGKVATTGRYDSRLYATMFFNDEYFNDVDAKRVYDKTFIERFNNNPDKLAFRKYLPPTTAEMNKSRVAVNVPLMRYADVLLMKAEVLNELGRTQEAIPLINEVRKRADMPALSLSLNKESVREKIEHERIVEFALENTRFYDLRRWNKAQSALQAVGRTGFDPSKHNFYPIPYNEIKSNNMVK